MPILEGADVRLNYFVEGDGPAATLLHGFTQSGRSWREVIATTPAGWRWIVPDLRGHGATRIQPGAPCTMDACTADLEMLWDHAGIEWEARESRRQGDEALAQRIEKEGLEAFINYWTALPLFAGLERRGPSFVAQVHAERMRNTTAGLAASLRGMGAGEMEPLWDQLGRVSFPSTFVAGQLDHGYVASARRLASIVPDSRVEIVLRAGHAVHQERPEAFARVLAAHLAAAGTRSAAERDSSSTSA